MKAWKHKTLAMVIAGLGLASWTQANADWLGDFYNAAGAGVNVTAPQAFASQSAVGFSGGGVSWRVPNKNFTPLSITPPSLKTGCGGIDMYLGGFSFPNKQAFVDALRNYGQAALGQYFLLALRSMAPEIAITLEGINDIAQRVNQFSMNSCQLAQEHASQLWDAYGGAVSHDASAYASAVGDVIDKIDGWNTTKASGTETMKYKYQKAFGTDKSSVSLTQMLGSPNPEMNFLHLAMLKANATNFTQEERELVMSLVGPSIILKYKSDGSGDIAPIEQAPSPTLTVKQLLGDGSVSVTKDSLRVLKCNDKFCLEPYVTTELVQTFAQRAYSLVYKMRQNVANRNSALLLSNDQLVVLKLSSVPLHRVAAMAETSGIAAVVGNSFIYDLTDYAALDALQHLINYYMTATDRALDAAKGEIPANYLPMLADMRGRIKTIREETWQIAQQWYANKGDPFEKIDQLEKAERAMYGTMNSMLAANARFGRR